MSDTSLKDFMTRSAVYQLAVRSPCNEEQAAQVVEAFNGDLDYLTLYGCLRFKGHTHDNAMDFLRNDRDAKGKEDHLLACVSEECGEVVRMVGKSHRFGSHDYNPKTNEQNWPTLQDEVHDVVAVYELLCHHMGTTAEFSRDKIAAKQEKTIRRMKEYGVIK